MKQKKIFDCMGEGCGECRVCDYLAHLEWAESVAIPGSSIERDEEIEAHLNKSAKAEAAVAVK